MENVFLHALLLACGLLAAGLALRASLPALRTLHIPAAVVAGVLGFAAVQLGLHVHATAEATNRFSAELSRWPGWLIAVVFAGLLLERSAGKGFAHALRRGTRSALLAWIIILGQIVIGLIVFAVAVRPFHPTVPATFGQLLEVSWAGGHGTSAAMGRIYEQSGFPAGRDLAFFLATVGLVYGVASGLVLVNVAVRRGWTRAGSGGAISVVTGLEPRRDPSPAAYSRTHAQVLDPLALQVIIVAAAFGAGYGLQQAFVGGTRWVFGGDSQAARSLANVPLFLFTLLGGLVVRQVMTRLRIEDLIDPASVQRLVGIAMEFLIVAAISTMRVEALRTFFLPVALLLAGAMAWSVFSLLVLAPRLLPKRHWFELGLLNYGFSTANTPQGMMLLRIVDPKLESGAAEDYAVAAPLSAPFIGGGAITIVGLPLVLQRVPALWVALALAVTIALLYASGRRLARGGE